MGVKERTRRPVQLAVVKMLRISAIISVLQVVAVLASNSEARSRNTRAIIVGGDEATVDNFPYQVSMRIQTQHVCGASVIGDRWALSAAHCCVGLQPVLVSLRAGSSRTDNGGIIYKVNELQPHAQYDSTTMDYDICAIQTEKPFQISKVIKPIALDPITFVYPSKAYAIISGWGRTENRPGAAGSTKLLSALVPMYNHGACARLYRSLHSTGYITERQICAGADPNGKDACQGDSGGPLAYNSRLVGIVSWGIGCGDRRYPGIYTSVAAMRGWIKTTTGI